MPLSAAGIVVVVIVVAICGAQEEACGGRSMHTLCLRLARLEARARFFSPMSLAANRDSLCKLGLKTHYIPDGAISSSSHLDEERSSLYHHKFGRLDEPRVPGINFGAWVAGRNNRGEWIQVDLPKKSRFTGVITQGRHDANHNQWVTRYRIAFQLPKDRRWRFVVNDDNEAIIFSGNSDGTTKVTNIFPNPFMAVRVRLVIEAWHNFIALRHEYLTC